jgi:hypothetical protein
VTYLSPSSRRRRVDNSLGHHGKQQQERRDRDRHAARRVVPSSSAFAISIRQWLVVTCVASGTYIHVLIDSLQVYRFDHRDRSPPSRCFVCSLPPHPINHHHNHHNGPTMTTTADAQRTPANGWKQFPKPGVCFIENNFCIC